MSLARATKAKLAVFGVAAALVTGLAAVASGATGAYFSDSKAGNITGTVGSIKVNLSGGAGSDASTFSFDRLLPGTPQTIKVTFQNTGNSPEDVYLTFPNKTSLSALNSLGTFGSAHVANAAGTEVFGSNNLNDNTVSCPPGSTSVAHPIPCDALPTQLLVASNVAPGDSGQASFTFGYASKLSTQSPAGGGVWNTYPVSGQVTTDAADGSGSGLPIAIVATQIGQTP
ncbi:hypothetical protein ACSMXN_06430 [Jatrophihabitans sp. DSM 45814]